jgi:hypothetical protein
LETAVERAVFFNVLAVLVEGAGADALEFAAGQGGFEDIGRVERTGSAAGAHDGVDLVDKKRMTSRLFSSSFMMALIRSSNWPRYLVPATKSSQVEHDDAFVEQGAAHFFLHDAQGQAFHDGRFTHARLADQDGVVLFAAAENLANPFDLGFASDDGVEFAFFGQFGDIAAKIIEHGVRLFCWPFGWLER